MTLLLSEAPLIVVKGAYRYESGLMADDGSLAVLSMAVSAASLYRALFHVAIMLLIQRKLDQTRKARRPTGASYASDGANRELTPLQKQAAAIASERSSGRGMHVGLAPIGGGSSAGSSVRLTSAAPDI